MAFRFAIIGAGLTGTSMLYQLVECLARQAGSTAIDPQRVQIRVFEKQSIAGPGFPHNERFVQPYHITNMCAEEMSVAYSNRGDFGEWVESRRPHLETRYPDLQAILQDTAYRRHGCSHYPRALMGEYLKSRFDEALKLAESLGTTVRVHTGLEVTDVVEKADGVAIHAQSCPPASSFYFDADRVLLATGHWPRSGSGCGYFASPWPAHRLLTVIPQGVEVAVIGSSLSAIETALTLTSDGGFRRTKSGQLVFDPPIRPRRITLLSRHGMLPKVRSRSVPSQTHYFNPQSLRQLLATHPGNLTLESVFQLLDRELQTAAGQSFDWRGLVDPQGSAMDILQQGLEAASGDEGPRRSMLWQPILRQAFPLVRELYLALSDAERLRFERDYATLFFAHAATQPPINAEKMLALMRSGVVTLVRLGRSYRFVEKAPGIGYEFVYGESETRVATFRYVVDARGQPASVRHDASRLTQNLLRGKMIHLDGIQAPGQQVRPEAASPALESSANHAMESVRIDPDSHRVIQVDHDGTARISKRLYAVGAMTRGQIIDVSMARGLTRSTDRIAKDLLQWLARNPSSSLDSQT